MWTTSDSFLISIFFKTGCSSPSQLFVYGNFFLQVGKQRIQKLEINTSKTDEDYCKSCDLI